LFLDIAWLKSRSGTQTDAVKEKLEEVSNMINETIENIKETSSFLRPDMLYELGLIPAINSQLKKFEKQSGIKCKFTYDLDLTINDDQLSLTLFRILQESLTNIARHSEASDTDVFLGISGQEIVMTVRDNGIGITKENINSMKAMGIAGMRERVRGVKGSLLINAENGVGTLINVKIPFNKSKIDD
jgi:signal transduction histidine kinase